MKKLLSIIFLLITGYVSSQSLQQVDLYNRPEVSLGDKGYYFKDTQGYFNQYTGNGVWQYSSGNLTMQLKFIKKTFTDVYQNKIDALIGGIRIVKNGVEVVNTLNINVNQNSTVDYFIYDGPRYKNTPNCMGCTTPDQRLYMFYNEPNNDNPNLAHMFFIMHVYKNAQQIPTLRVVFTQEALSGDPTEYDTEFNHIPTKTQVYLPFGTFDFQKVN
ncbi:DUF6705 family protein [Paenimyroides ceti]|nr:DUF6705 family protein [Paenimyroides ceti]